MASETNWTDDYPTEDVVHKFQYLDPSLESLFIEMRELSKKKPDGVVTAFKLRFINKTLLKIGKILVGDPSLANVEELTEDTLPQFSDVVLVLGQFRAAMQRFHDKFHTSIDGWRTKEKMEANDGELESDEEDEDDEDYDDEEGEPE